MTQKEQWILDIEEHRRLVKYYMQDYEDMAKDAIHAKLRYTDLFGLTVFACSNIDMSPTELAHTVGWDLANSMARQDRRNIARDLEARAEVHDLSKLHDPEAATFRVYTPKLRALEYGSDAYRAALEGMGDGLRHHYAVNSHHPEYYERGVRDMTFLDIVEMFCDWCAACDFNHVLLDIDAQAKRFDMDAELRTVLTNTRDILRHEMKVHGVPHWF